jgi:hypothetical protein
MNQGPRYVRLMEKSRGQKSRATVPLSCGRQEYNENLSMPVDRTILEQLVLVLDITSCLISYRHEYY